MSVLDWRRIAHGKINVVINKIKGIGKNPCVALHVP